MIVDDLAKVNHIFCDKTGTLTKNELIFRGLGIEDNKVVVDPKSSDPM